MVDPVSDIFSLTGYCLYFCVYLNPRKQIRAMNAAAITIHIAAEAFFDNLGLSWV